MTNKEEIIHIKLGVRIVQHMHRLNVVQAVLGYWLPSETPFGLCFSDNISRRSSITKV